MLGRSVKRYDAIVVGAGPAGSTVAYRLATAGASVLLLDRAAFPRDKPCGGGVTLRAARLVPFPIDPVVEDVVGRVELRLRYTRGYERGDGRPLILMTRRRRLDHFLAERAASAGVEFRDGARASGVETGRAGVTVVVDGERISGRTLIGADGVNGVVARAVELGGNRAVGVALEANVPYERIRGRYRGRAVLELGILPGGYGWVFPKDDHVNIGVGGWEREAPRLRGELARLCGEHSVSVGDLADLRGYRLPCRLPDSRLSRGRVLLVGDAAGLIDPLTGDGMYEAFLSAKLAAEAVLDLLGGGADSLEEYEKRLSSLLARHLWASWGVKEALDRFPRATFALSRLPVVWRVVERVVRGELRDVTEARGLARPPLKALALLALAAGDPGRAYRGR